MKIVKDEDRLTEKIYFTKSADELEGKNIFVKAFYVWDRFHIRALHDWRLGVLWWAIVLTPWLLTWYLY